jgi:hypothetical protein
MILVGANNTNLHGQSADHSPQPTLGPSSMPQRTCQSDARKANTLTLPRDCRAALDISKISKRRNIFRPVLRTILQHPVYRLLFFAYQAFHFASTCLLQPSHTGRTKPQADLQPSNHDFLTRSHDLSPPPQSDWGFHHLRGTAPVIFPYVSRPTCRTELEVEM